MTKRWTVLGRVLPAVCLLAGCGSAGIGDDDDADVTTEGGDEFDVPPDGDVVEEDAGDAGDGPDGTCHCVADEECEDDLFCNGSAECVACECRAGIPPDDGTACDDGDPCTADEACMVGVCTGGVPTCFCDVDDDCLEYDDGDRCNGRLVCEDRLCRFAPETVVVCDDSGDTDCRVNRCVRTTGACEPTPVDDGTGCDDGNACTAADVCLAGACLSGASTCECEATIDCAAHEDGDRCNGTLVCDTASHSCVIDPGTIVTCDPGGDTTCRVNRCVPATGACELQPRGEGSRCDDGNACTIGEACAGGACAGGSARTCNDGNACTDDSCAPATGCVYANNTAACDDGNACTIGEACAGGACAGGSARTCNDGNVCTDDSCAPATGCVYANNTAACDDGRLCTTPDACSGGVCVGTVTGLTECDGACWDLRTSREHCGSCGNACRFDEDCTLGSCTVRAWGTVGRAVNPTLPALAHALGSDGSVPWVAWVADEPAQDNTYVHRVTGTGDWTQAGGALNTAGPAQPVVDIAFRGTAPFVFYMDQSMMMTPNDHVKTWDPAGTGWTEIGAPGYRQTCVMSMNASLALNGALPHLSTVGAGGCGIGVGYAYWTGAAWWDTPNPPSPMGTGLLTMNGGGCSDVVHDGTRAYVALLDGGWRYVRYWQAPVEPGSWVNLGPSFNRNPPPAGTAGHNYLSMALDGTNRIWVAFAEHDAGRQKVFVVRYEPLLGTWTLVGGGPIGDPTLNSDFPSLAFVGGMPHVAWVEDVAASGTPSTAGGVIRLARWNGTAWQRVGAPLNNDVSADAVLPYVAAVGAVPYVAFREPAVAPQRIYVKRFP
jgi:hypothetical protein